MGRGGGGGGVPDLGWDTFMHDGDAARAGLFSRGIGVFRFPACKRNLIFVDRWLDLHDFCFDVLILVVMASDLANCYCDFSKSY